MKFEEYLEKYPDIDFGEVKVKRLYRQAPCQEDFPYDERDYTVLNEFEIYLPHRCDEWVIGGIEEAKEISKNILEAVAYVERSLSENN